MCGVLAETAIIASIGLTVPIALETCTIATSFVFGPIMERQVSVRDCHCRQLERPAIARRFVRRVENDIGVMLHVGNQDFFPRLD